MSITGYSTFSNSLKPLLNAVKRKFGGPSNLSTESVFLSLVAPGESLQELCTSMKEMFPEASGSITAPISKQSTSEAWTHSVGVLLLPESNTHSSFNSSLSGISPAEVGRWHRPNSKGIQQRFDNTLSLRKDVEGASTLLYFSDGSPEGFHSYLNEVVPGANKLGIVAAPTPFHTGRPFSLFERWKWQSQGAIGIQINQPGSIKLRSDQLKPVGTPLRVTSTEGNIITEINNGPATSTLLSVLQSQHGGNSEKWDGRLFLTSMGIGPIWSITGGSLSRGTLLVEAATAPASGTEVQLHIYQPLAGPMSWMTQPHQSPVTLVISDHDLPHSDSNTRAKEEDVLELDSFVVGTRDGVYVQRSSADPYVWNCKVPDSRLELTF